MSKRAAPVIARADGPNIVIRFFWFIFIGWWLGGIVSGLAWLLFVTIIGIPVALWIINRLPTVITLRPQEQNWHVEGDVLTRGVEQHPFWIRALYFILIGWWLNGVWMTLAYMAVVSIALLPLAFWMYGRVGAITTLYRS